VVALLQGVEVGETGRHRRRERDLKEKRESSGYKFSRNRSWEDHIGGWFSSGKGERSERNTVSQD